MRTILTKVYKFNELSETAKEKAISHFYDINVRHEWWDCIYEDAKNIGLQITSFDLDGNRHTKGEFNLSANEVAANIFRDHGENCQTYKTASSFMAEWEPVFSKYMTMEGNEEELEEELINIESEFLNSILEDYSILLQHEYEYLTSEEAIIGTILANEYEFTKDGNLFS